jgi:hypothetical protein
VLEEMAKSVVGLAVKLDKKWALILTMRVQSNEEERITNIKLKGKRDVVDTLEELRHMKKMIRMMFTQE